MWSIYCVWEEKMRREIVFILFASLLLLLLLFYYYIVEKDVVVLFNRYRRVVVVLFGITILPLVSCTTIVTKGISELWEGNCFCISVDEIRGETGTQISSHTRTTDILSNIEASVFDTFRGSLLLMYHSSLLMMLFKISKW